ncbi:MAG: HIT domain-containing protein [Spirochaetes bacterium]|nr:HIT domain-containing protein [Spirochaetota bacterium]
MPSKYFLNFDKINYFKNKPPRGCILCLIRDNSPEIVDLTIYRDELFIITVNLYPYNPGHLLVFPLRHIEDIREYTEKEEIRLAALIKYILDITDKAYAPSGYNIGYNMGLTAGASIRHLHIHIIPRFPREIGIADLIAGKRVLVEDPGRTAEKLKVLVVQSPFSISNS